MQQEFLEYELTLDHWETHCDTMINVPSLVTELSVVRPHHHLTQIITSNIILFSFWVESKNEICLNVCKK